MTVLVTGATGSVGQAAVARLLAEGRKVSVLTRRPFRAHALFSDSVARHEWHPLSEPVPPEALAGVTAILHLMGEPLAGRPSHDRADLALTSRRNASRKLVEAVAGRPMRLVAASLAIASSAAGDRVGEISAASATPNAVERDVAAWEAEIIAAASADISVANVRLGLVSGPGTPLAELVSLARSGIQLNLKGALIPAIDLADAAAMLSGLLSRPDLTGMILGVAPEPVKGEDLARLLSTASRIGLPMPVPRAVVRHRLGHIMGLLDNTERRVPQRLIELGAEFSAPDPLPSFERAIAAMLGTDAGRPPLAQRLKALLPAKPARPA